MGRIEEAMDHEIAEMSEVDKESPEEVIDESGEAGSATRAPFERAPRDLPTSNRGCSKMVFAGCGLVALVLGLGVLTMILKATDLVAWSLSRIRVEVERTLPEDLPRIERQRLGAAFDAATQRIEGGDLDPIAFQALQGELLRFARLSRPPTVEEVRVLVEALEAFAHVGSEEPAREVEPAHRVALGES